MKDYRHATALWQQHYKAPRSEAEADLRLHRLADAELAYEMSPSALNQARRDHALRNLPRGYRGLMVERGGVTGGSKLLGGGPWRRALRHHPDARIARRNRR